MSRPLIRPARLGAALIGLGAVGAPIACDQEGTSSAPVTVRDSAGITLIENGRPGPGPQVGDGTAPSLHIGVLEGAPEYQFSRLTGMTRMPDGRIAVADGQGGVVRIYGADGEHLRAVSGPGEGPSELRYPVGIRVLAGDTLLVIDRMDRLRFDPDGGFIDRQIFDRQTFGTLWEGRGFAEGGSWLADGSLFTPVYGRSSPDTGPFRPPMTLVRITEGLERVDTLGFFGGSAQERVDVGGGQTLPMVPPFAVRTTWAVGAEDGTVAVGDSEHPQVHLFGPDGSHRIVRWSDEPEPVTDAEVEAWKERQRNASWTQGRLPQLERGWARMTMPETKARFQGIDLARDGGLWVRIAELDAAGPEWLVFDRDGRYRGRFWTGEPFEVREIGDAYVLGVHRDEHDVEYVRMYDLGG